MAGVPRLRIRIVAARHLTPSLECGQGRGGPSPSVSASSQSKPRRREHRRAIDFNPVMHAIDQFLERRLPFYYFELEQATMAGSDRLRGFAR